MGLKVESLKVVEVSRFGNLRGLVIAENRLTATEASSLEVIEAAATEGVGLERTD